MGQQVGRMPRGRAALTKEWCRVLHWSAEVLARAEDSVDSEDVYLADYDVASIVAKVDRWLGRSCAAFHQISIEAQYRMRNDYDRAYEDLRKMYKALDKIAERQRKIHEKILDLEKLLANDTHKFKRRLGRLRVQVFKHLRMTEKIFFQERRLRHKFDKKAYQIDRVHMEWCKKKVEQFVKNIERNAATNL